MTTPETQGPPMSPEDAMAELRRIAGGQLDAELAETFIALLERKGPNFGREADYKTELAFESRVRKMAQPRSAGSDRDHVSTPVRESLSSTGARRARIRKLRQRA
jgi:hypothetical protein